MRDIEIRPEAGEIINLEIVSDARHDLAENFTHVERVGPHGKRSSFKGAAKYDARFEIQAAKVAHVDVGGKIHAALVAKYRRVACPVLEFEGVAGKAACPVGIESCLADRVVHSGFALRRVVNRREVSFKVAVDRDLEIVDPHSVAEVVALAVYRKDMAFGTVDALGVAGQRFEKLSAFVIVNIEGGGRFGLREIQTIFHVGFRLYFRSVPNVEVIGRVDAEIIFRAAAVKAHQASFGTVKLCQLEDAVKLNKAGSGLGDAGPDVPALGLDPIGGN